MRLISLLCALCLAPATAFAHATEGAFVLLLPTDFYITGGALSVVLTVLLVSVLPDRYALGLFKPLRLWRSARRGAPLWLSLLSTLVLGGLIYAGINGADDPMHNPLPLSVWSLFWVMFVVVQGLVGDLWRWLNPWSGVYSLLRRAGARRLAVLPAGLGYWPALLTFLGFVALLLVHPAPAEPEVLAPIVAGYWLFTLLGMLVFGPKWVRRAEGLSVMLSIYALMSGPGRAGGRWRFGVPGWKLIGRGTAPLSLAVMVVIMLALGSFDGVNETFWWLAQIGVNPLEFPGRSAVVIDNALGMLAALWLVPAFAATVWLGLWLARETARFREAFCSFAMALLPIALAYHFAHYFPSFLVEIQYAVKVANDPFDSGAALLGLRDFYVTTGFFNTHETVHMIWLIQAGAVVLGHVIAIVASHALAARLFNGHRQAVLSQIPLALFMVGYTTFGLWLLASPRGV